MCTLTTSQNPVTVSKLATLKCLFKTKMGGIFLKMYLSEKTPQKGRKKKEQNIYHELLLSLTSITMTYLSSHTLKFTAHRHSKISF